MTQNLLALATRSILGQEAARVTWDLINDQAHPDFLFDVLNSIDADVRRDFVHQIQKMIIEVKR